MRETPRFEIQLIHIHGSLKGEISSFVTDQITIGRQHNCSVKFPPEEQGVSRNHATIQREGNQFRLIDTSTYGTFVNGKQAGESTFLRSGDVLEIGPGGPKVSFHAEIIEGEIPAVEPVQLSVPVAPAPTPNQTDPPRVAPQVLHATPQKALLSVAKSVSQQLSEPQSSPVQQPQRQQISEQPVAPPPSRPAIISIEKTVMPLIIQYGPAIRSYNELPVVIGSDATADFVLQYPGISGRHLQLFHSRGAYWVKNLTGVGIVSVNREKLEGQVQLKPFDEIECCPGGPMFRFIGEGRLVEVEQAQPAAPWIAQNIQNSTPVVNPVKEKDSGGFFSKLVKGFK